MNPKKLANTSTANRLLLILLLSLLFFLPSLSAQSPAPPVSPPAAAEPDPPPDSRLTAIKRICVHPFGDDALGVQAQEMVIARLFESKKFSLTENCDRADFVLKGTVTERNERFARSESEGIGFSTRASASSNESTGSGAGRESSGASASGGLAANTQESLSSSGYKQTAAVTLRIVDKNGEILWAVSMESAEGKTRSAIGEAAERAVRRFLRDVQRAASPPAEKPPVPAASSPAANRSRSSNKNSSSRNARSPQSAPVRSQPSPPSL